MIDDISGKEVLTREDCRQAAPFSAGQESKEAFFQKEMKQLTDHHRKSCRAYDDICNGLCGHMPGARDGQGPYLPVTLFKDLQLRSVPEEEVVRQVTSSGTSGQKVSRIYLDAETAELQRWALAAITGDFIGEKRMPMLIIDSPDVLRDRRKFSARGAGILGFSMMSSKRFYALDNEMGLDLDSIRAFCEAAKAGPSFAFGFTFMIWSCFIRALAREGIKLDLPGCYLIHGGGWKKLQDQKVSDEEFRAALKDQCGIGRVSDYYGMAEQTGSIFMQCEQGHLHASVYSDIEVLDPEDFTPCPKGKTGLIALRSWIPGSYPGHKLLTEDEGRILGEDDCPCGRKGRYFQVLGRIRKAEIRGCSDTFEEAGREADGLQLLAGDWPPAREEETEPPAPDEFCEAPRTPVCFDPLVTNFLSDLSVLFMKDPSYRQYPDIYALGFWCRPAHIEQLRGRQEKMEAGGGLVLHIAPSNMPAMFAYSWITALLAGNDNVVRISARPSPVTDKILEGINSLLCRDEYELLRRRNAFVRFPRGHEALERISKAAKARVIWGGDETVRAISQVPAAKDTIDIGFPDKYSIAVLDGEAIENMSEDELRMQAHLFCRDTYGADQNACSSPRSVFWIGKDLKEVKRRWWDMVAEEAGRYELQPWMATEKYRQLCLAYAAHEKLEPVRTWTNRLYVVGGGRAACWGEESLPEARLGIFYEFDAAAADELIPLLKEKIQTAVCVGTDPEAFYQKAREAGAAGLDRAVAAGQALEFDTIWDRKDLIGILSR